MLGRLWAYWEASPWRVPHQRPAVRPENADGERKAKPHPKSHPERTVPPPQKCEDLGPCSDPVTHPILSSNFRAEPALESAAAQHDPGEQRGLRHTAGPAFFQEAAPATPPRGTCSLPELLVGHTGRATRRVCLAFCRHVPPSLPTATAQRWPQLLVLPLGRSGPPAGTRAVANARQARKRAVGAGTVKPVGLLFGQLAVFPSSVFGLVNHDCAGRHGRLDLPVGQEVKGRLGPVVLLEASPLL